MARIVVYCQPGARQTRLSGLHDGKPKIQLQAPPVDGEANQALVKFLAGLLGVPRARVSIEAGSSSRTKRIEVAGVEDADLRTALGLPPSVG